MTVPWLLLVVHSSGGYWLFAAEAGLGELLIIAGVAVNIISFGEETLRCDGSPTAATGETVIVPRVSFVCHTLAASQYGFIAAVAAGSSVSGAAFHTHDALILGVEWLLGQRLVTLSAAETLFMPVTSFVAQLLGLD